MPIIAHNTPLPVLQNLRAPYILPVIKVKVKFTLEQATKTSALDGGRVVNATPRPLYPRERPCTHCIGGWMGPRAGLDGCGKSRPYRDSIPGPSIPQPVAKGCTVQGSFTKLAVIYTFPSDTTESLNSTSSGIKCTLTPEDALGRSKHVACIVGVNLLCVTATCQLLSMCHSTTGRTASKRVHVMLPISKLEASYQLSKMMILSASVCAISALSVWPNADLPTNFLSLPDSEVVL